jgi:hypothetical protein
MVVDMRRTVALALGLLALLGEALLPMHLALPPAHSAPRPTRAAVSASAMAAPPGTVTVAAANIREGSVVRHPYDRSDVRDRDAFVRRLMVRGRQVPDVVLLQEVLGTAGKVAAALTRRARAQGSTARYVVAMAPRMGTRQGTCGGPRSGPYTAVRDSAVLVNTRTVRRIRNRGVVRTWGRWNAEAGAVLGSGSLACSEHPWMRLSVRQPGGPVRNAVVMAAHVAPLDMPLKTEAVLHLSTWMDRLNRAFPAALVVLGGDLNQTRCVSPATTPEPADCRLRPGHDSLQTAGFRDAVRARNLTGPRGVVGVQRRIDFIYTTAVVRSSSFDRCYQAFYVTADPCGARAVFATKRKFSACQTRALEGRRTSCSNVELRRYYSDHPVLRATVR